MDKTQFIKKVGSPVKFTSQERGWLHAVQAKYPFSSVVNVLTLLADRAFKYDTPAQRRATMLSMCDSTGLKPLLVSAVGTREEPSFDVLSEINTFQEVSFKTAPKSVILSNFLNVAPAAEVEKAREAEPAPAGDDKKSLRPTASLGTETLAVILEKQGKYEKAIEVYRNLMAQNPEKSSNFAARIERLETLINSK